MDCDDSNPAINPGATEVCDNVDDDCDATTLGPDVDGDGFVSSTCCNGSSCGRDCDDRNPELNPFHHEVCNGIDDNCDGDIDEGVRRLMYVDQDEDEDGHGDSDQPAEICPGLRGYSPNPGDCNDRRAAIHPSQNKVCSDIDDDCDGLIDEGVKRSMYRDADADGHGDPTAPVAACAGFAGFSTNFNDCDDENPAVVPGAMVCDPANPRAVQVCGSEPLFQTMECPRGTRCVQQPNGTGTCQPGPGR